MGKIIFERFDYYFIIIIIILSLLFRLKTWSAKTRGWKLWTKFLMGSRWARNALIKTQLFLRMCSRGKIKVVDNAELLKGEKEKSDIENRLTHLLVPSRFWSSMPGSRPSKPRLKTLETENWSWWGSLPIWHPSLLSSSAALRLWWVMRQEWFSPKISLGCGRDVFFRLLALLRCRWPRLPCLSQWARTTCLLRARLSPPSLSSTSCDSHWPCCLSSSPPWCRYGHGKPGVHHQKAGNLIF